MKYECDIFSNGELVLSRDAGRVRASELATILKRIPAGCSVRSSAPVAEYVPLLAAAEKSERALVVGRGPSDGPWVADISGSNAVPEVAGEFAPLPNALGVTAAFWTSGSTGPAKLILHTADAMSYQADATYSLLGLTTPRWGVALPLDHAYGYSVANLARTHGRQLHWYSSTSIKKLAKSVAMGAIDTLDTIPIIWDYLLQMARRDPVVMAGLRGLALRGVGGQLLAPDLAHSFAEIDAPLHDGYGLTEAGPNVAINVSDTYVHGTVGRPLPGTKLRVEADELFVRSPSVSPFIWRNGRVERNPSVDENGWLQTGDVAHFDDVLTIRGRTDFMLQQAGEKTAPESIESSLRFGLNPGETVFVTSVGTNRHGDELLAVIVAPPAAAEDALRRVRLNASKLQRPFRINRFVRIAEGDLSLTPLGKVNRTALAGRRWLED